MISGRPERPFLAAATVVMALWIMGAAVAGDVEDLLRTLVRPAPDEIPFVEVRFSPLLDTPVVASGRLEYLAPGRLARHVVDPYREDTSIDGEQVVLSREGEKARQFSLRRAPELRGLLSSFSAILSGDAAALDETFEMSLSREVPAGRWTLRLAPRDASLRKRLGDIEVHGGEGTVSCIVMGPQPDSASFTVLGRLPGELPGRPTFPALQEFCTRTP